MIIITSVFATLTLVIILRSILTEAMDFNTFGFGAGVFYGMLFLTLCYYTYKLYIGG